MDDIVVLHSSDASECSKYILNYLARDEYHLRTSSLLDSSFDLDRTATKVKVLILILSAGHLDFLRNCSASSSYEEQIRTAGTTLVYLYGLGEDEEEQDNGEVSRESEKSLRNQIPGYRELQKFTFEQHEELLKTTMIKVEGLDTPEPIGQGARAAEKKTGVAGRKTSKSKRSRKFRVIPKTARCETSTAMIISLCDTAAEDAKDTGKKEEEDREEERRKGRMEEDSRDVVTVAFGSNNPEQQIVLPTERISRNIYLFFAPEHSEGVVPIHIVVNGDVIGQSSVVYQSLQSDLVLAVSQIYMFLLNRLLGLLQDSGQLTTEVDRRLCGLLEDEEANSIPIQAFEQLFSLSAACKGRSDCELPTLLHLAAKYDLTDFASKLKDLPDAGLASELRNHLGQTPEELGQLARSRGNAPQANGPQRHKHPMLPNASRVEEEEEGVYERFSPIDEPLNSSSADREDPANPYGMVYEEEDPYMVMPSDEIETERGERSVAHPMFPPMFPQLPTDNKGEAGHPPSLVINKQDELIPKPLKTKGSIVDRIFKKKSSPKQSKTTLLLSPSSPSIPEEQYPPPPSHYPTSSSSDIYSSSPRNSIASSSSRDSCMSKGSTSGIETVDEEDDENGCYQSTVTTYMRRKSSANLEQLEEALRRPNAPRPPPPPPRRTPMKPSTVDPDKVEYLTMDGTHNKTSPSNGQRRAGPPVGQRTRKMSCPAVAPYYSPFNRQCTSGPTDEDDYSLADGDAKHSPGVSVRPTSIEVESVRTVPLPVRKMSLPNRFPESSARGRPLPPIKK